MKPKVNKPVKDRKIPYVYIAVIIILIAILVVLSVHSLTGYSRSQTVKVTSQQLSFSAVNVNYSYSGFFSGYFENQTIPNVKLNETNGNFTIDLFITNENLIHKVNVSEIESVTPGFKVVSSSGINHVLSPNQSVELIVTLGITNNTINNSYNGPLNLEIYTNSSLSLPKSAINISSVNLTDTVNPCSKSYSSFSGQYINYTQLNSNYYESFNIQITGKNAKLLLNMSSNSDFMVALLNPSQFQSWESTGLNPIGAVYLNYTYNVYKNISIPPGNWYFIIWNNASYSSILNYASFNVYYPYIDPYNLHSISYNQTNASLPAPTGLASYGLDGNNGNPYCIKTSGLLGLVNIKNISSFALNPPKDGGTSYASLQLNGMLYVTNNNGVLFNYWLQNTMTFETDYYYDYNTVNIYNETGSFLANLTNTSIQGNGYVYNSKYYAQSTSSSQYSLPINKVFMTNISVETGKGIFVYFYILPFNNVSPYNTEQFTGKNIYSKVFISDPNVSSAYFLISGYRQLNNSQYYDAEFTFGGGGNGENSFFYNTTSADIGLMYLDDQTNSFVNFPSYYAFGSDTAEGAYNLNVTKISYPSWATADVGWINGTPSLGYLG